jgi:hypothetical protein
MFVVLWFSFLGTKQHFIKNFVFTTRLEISDRAELSAPQNLLTFPFAGFGGGKVCLGEYLDLRGMK